MTARGWQHHFRRRARAAREGRHLPTVDELLLGMAWLEDSLDLDAQAFAQAVRPKLPGGHPDIDALAHLLDRFRIAPMREELEAAADGFRALDGQMTRPDPLDCARRCDLYAACLGSGEAAWRVALEALARLRQHRQDPERLIRFAESALGFLAISSADDRRLRFAIMAGTFRWSAGRDIRDLAHEQGAKFVSLIAAAADRIGAGESDEAAGSATGSAGARRGRGDAADGLSRGDDEIDGPGAPGTAGGAGPSRWTARAVAAGPSTPPARAEARVVVIPTVGGRETSSGRRVETEFQPVLGKELPLIAVPDLTRLRHELIKAFPYAGAVIDAVLADLVARPVVRLRPTLLVGPPGCGKTEFARALLSGLALPHELYSCGGVADASLGGTSRRWATGEPALPVALMLRHRLASPAIILDELEKTGTSRHNGNLLDALLGLLEPASAQGWHDPYVEAAVDVSHLVWIATANTLDPVPSPLRDRLRLIHFPEPGPDHLDVMARRLLASVVTERGLDPRWALPIDGEERAVLARHWRGGSIRRLRALVDRLVAIREQRGPVQ